MRCALKSVLTLCSYSERARRLNVYVAFTELKDLIVTERKKHFNLLMHLLNLFH